MGQRESLDDMGGCFGRLQSRGSFDTMFYCEKTLCGLYSPEPRNVGFNVVAWQPLASDMACVVHGCILFFSLGRGADMVAQ